MTKSSVDNRGAISRITIADPHASLDHALFAIGDPALLNRRRIGLLCSVQCPGDIILKTLDLMQELRDADICVVSGFHSPMEQECLKVLLRGEAGVAICHARGLPRQVPPDHRPAIADRRMLLVSPFDESQSRVTRETSMQRNRLVVSLADVVIAPYATPGGMTEAVFNEAVDLGKPVFTFAGAGISNSQAAGGEAMLLTGAAAILRNISSGETPFKGYGHSAEVTSTPIDKRKYRLSDIRRNHPRAYEKWTADEETRLVSLHNAGRTTREMAEELQRQPGAISSRLRKLGL